MATNLMNRSTPAARKKGAAQPTLFGEAPAPAASAPAPSAASTAKGKGRTRAAAAASAGEAAAGAAAPAPPPARQPVVVIRGARSGLTRAVPARRVAETAQTMA